MKYNLLLIDAKLSFRVASQTICFQKSSRIRFQVKSQVNFQSTFLFA